VEYFKIQDAKNKERALKRESVGGADHKVRQVSIYGAELYVIPLLYRLELPSSSLTSFGIAPSYHLPPVALTFVSNHRATIQAPLPSAG
jgi:hypothetical protein